VNEIRQYKEMVFGLILAQSGKAISRWKRRSDDDVGEGAVNRLTR